MNKTIKEIRATIKELSTQKENALIVDRLSNIADELELKSKEEKKEREELFKFLYGGHTWTKVKTVFEKDFRACKNQDEVIDLYNKFIPYIWFNRAFNYSLNIYVDLRNVIESCDTKHKDFAKSHVFSIGDKDKSKGVFAFKAKKTEKKTLKRKEENTTEFNVKNVEKVVNKLKDYVDNFDDKLKEGIIKKPNSAKVDIIKAYYISFLLGLTTGRRQVELLKTLEIGSRKGKAMFKGLVKQPKNAKEAQEGNIIFLSVKDAQKYLRLLRKLLPTDDMTNTEVNKKYNAMFNKAFKDRLVYSEINIVGKDSFLFGNEDVKFHKLRTAYALTNYEMAVEEENKKSEDKRVKIDKSKFIADVLHQTWKMNASEHYDSKL